MRRMQFMIALIGVALAAWCLATGVADAQPTTFDLDRRIAVLETRLDTITSMGQGILVLVGAHLLVTMIGVSVVRPRRREYEDS